MPILQSQLEPLSEAEYVYQVEQIDLIFNQIIISKWENQDHFDNGDTEFRIHQTITVRIPNLQEIASTEIEALKQICYNYLQEPNFIQNNPVFMTVEPILEDPIEPILE